MDAAGRLHAIGAEIAQIQTEIAILEEQYQFLSDTAEDARIRALVSETPLADREDRVAREDLERARRVLDEVRARLAALREEQDRLLDQMPPGEPPESERVP